MGQLFILIYCSDYFANNKRSTFFLQWPARWIKGETIYFNSRAFRGTKFSEVTDSRKLKNLLSRMVILIFASYQMRINWSLKFLQIKNFKKYENYFLWKKCFLRSIEVKIREQNFFLKFFQIYFRERLDLKNFARIIFANLQNNIFWDSF